MTSLLKGSVADTRGGGGGGGESRVETSPPKQKIPKAFE